MTKIDNQQSTPGVGRSQSATSSDDGQQSGSFGTFMDRVADGALNTVSTVAPAIPGGKLVKMAADGLKALKDRTPAGLAGNSGPGGMSRGESQQLDDMWEMQRQNQVYNMQYFKLQQAAQQQNRRFKALSNLMKVRHDTAKSAINNMRA
jgi:hypothetical protein